MKKIGIHLSSYCTSWKEDLKPHILKSQDIGFDAVEIPLFDALSFASSQFLSVLKDTDLEVTTCNGITREYDIASFDRKIRKRGISYLKQAIDCSLEIGAKSLNGVLYEPWGEGICLFTDEMKKVLDESLIEVDAYACETGLPVNLELINRYEGRRLNTIAQGIDLIDRLELKQIKLHIDTFHMNIEETDPVMMIHTAKERIGHVHISENTRGRIGTGTIDIRSIIQALNEINYQGYFVIESFIGNHTEIGEDLHLYQNRHESRTQMIASSYEFLRHFDEK